MTEAAKPKTMHVIGSVVLLLVNLVGGWLAGIRTGADSNADAVVYMLSSAVLLPLVIVAIALIWKSQRNAAACVKNFMLGSALAAISNYGILFT